MQKTDRSIRKSRRFVKINLELIMIDEHKSYQSWNEYLCVVVLLKLVPYYVLVKLGEGEGSSKLLHQLLKSWNGDLGFT